MSKRRSKSPHVHVAQPQAAAGSALIRMTVLASFVAIFGTVLILRYAHLPLGQGSFQYRLSQRESERTIRAVAMLPAAAMILGAIIAATSRRRSASIALASLAVVALGLWIWWAPPAPLSQHSFNLRSPSHEGAFVLEADRIDDLRTYLAGFDRRIQRPIEQMGGTRIISNPPGMTIVFYAIAKFVGEPNWLVRMLERDYDVPSFDVPFAVRTIEYAAALTMIWALSAGAIFLAARTLLPTPGAMLATLIAWFNPSTVHFVPGKDPAQLLTIGLMMWLCLSGWRGGSVVRCVGAGAVLALGATVGLVHFWVAAAIVAACAWEDWRRSVRLIVAMICGFFAVVLIVYFLSGWNMLATFVTVSRRYTQIQRDLKLDHAIWFFIGLPIFLLFVSPALAGFAALWLRRRRMNLGARLALSTVAVMLICYIVGVSYELPRLWVAFLPPLTIGLLSATPMAHVRHEGRARRAILFLAAAHMIFTVLHWTQLDARESEYRLTSQRFFTINGFERSSPARHLLRVAGEHARRELPPLAECLARLSADWRGEHARRLNCHHMVRWYHAIFSAYGFWLPNDPRGSWSEFVGAWELYKFGQATKTTQTRSLAHDPHDRDLRLAAKSALKYPAVRFDESQRSCIARGIGQACEESRIDVLTCAIGYDHVHVVTERHAKSIEQIVGHLKGRATQQLSRAGCHPLAECSRDAKSIPSPWSEGCWSVFINDCQQLRNAVDYVKRHPTKEGLHDQHWEFVKPLPV